MMTPIFALAMAQSNIEALAAFAQERNVLNPLTTPDCSTAPAASPARPATPPRQRQASR
jgi:hypothetical protein